MDRSKVPQRLFDALDRGDAGVFLRFWSALPVEGRLHHPLACFVYAALTHLGSERRTGAQVFADDQRSSKQIVAMFA